MVGGGELEKDTFIQREAHLHVGLGQEEVARGCFQISDASPEAKLTPGGWPNQQFAFLVLKIPTCSVTLEQSSINHESRTPKPHAKSACAAAS